MQFFRIASKIRKKNDIFSAVVSQMLVYTLIYLQLPEIYPLRFYSVSAVAPKMASTQKITLRTA